MIPPRPCLFLLAAACVARVPEERAPALHAVRSWAVQLQGLERKGAVDALERAPVDLLVLEPMRSVRGREGFPTASVVRRLKRGKLCLAYVNIGQAEEYRTYWGSHWRAPTAERRGLPSYLLAPDPAGWPGNYPVSFWDIRWQALLWGSPRALLDQALEDGFDGVYLDWVLGFDEPPVVAAAREEGVDPAAAMVALIRDLRAYAGRRRPGFLVVAQNAARLVERRPELAGLLDAISQESLLFHGTAGAAWEEAAAGDFSVPAQGGWSTATTLRRLRSCRERGLPVFTLDYARDPGHVARARAFSRAHGFVPFVSLSPLDRLPASLFADPR